MKSGRVIRRSALLCAVVALACGRDSTGPIPDITGSYTGQSTMGQVTLHIEQSGQQLGGQGTFVDAESIAQVMIDGRIIAVRNGHRINVALPSIRFPDLSISADVAGKGILAGTMTDGARTAQIILQFYETTGR